MATPLKEFQGIDISINIDKQADRDRRKSSNPSTNLIYKPLDYGDSGNPRHEPGTHRTGDTEASKVRHLYHLPSRQAVQVSNVGRQRRPVKVIKVRVFEGLFGRYSSCRVVDEGFL